MDALAPYLARVAAPSLALVAFIALVPRSAKGLRLAAAVLLFMVARDAMTPVGLWTLSPSLTMRFIASPVVLWVLALTSLGLAVGSQVALGGLDERKVWFVSGPVLAVALGLLGALLVAAPAMLARLWAQEVAPPRPSGLAVLIGVLALALLGNLLDHQHRLAGARVHALRRGDLRVAAPACWARSRVSCTRSRHLHDCRDLRR